MLAEVPRFHRAATAAARPTTADDPTLGRVPRRRRLLRLLRRATSRSRWCRCVWSCGDARRAAYPARHLFALPRPPRHAPGDRLARPGAPSSAVRRPTSTGSSTRLPDVRRGERGHRRDPARRRGRRAHGRRPGRDATTASSSPPTPTRRSPCSPTPTPEEKRRPRRDHATRATRPGCTATPRCCPGRRAARASWNYRIDAATRPADGVTVSYWMNRLQGLEDADDHVVTLNPAGRVDPATVIGADELRRTRSSPPRRSRPPQRLRTAGGDRLAFAGAHLGWGFHEDGCRSGVEAAASLGVRLVSRRSLPRPCRRSSSARSATPGAPRCSTRFTHRPLPVARRPRRPAPAALADAAARPLRRPRPPRPGRLGGGIRGDVERFLRTPRRRSSTPTTGS